MLSFSQKTFSRSFILTPLGSSVSLSGEDRRVLWSLHALGAEEPAGHILRLLSGTLQRLESILVALGRTTRYHVSNLYFAQQLSISAASRLPYQEEGTYRWSSQV